jgi:predicted metal-dependent phosphoesterase TrpH
VTPGAPRGRPRRYVDLHTHSTHSDGTLTVPELAGAIRASGISAVALTDHDTLDGVPALAALLEPRGIEVIAGVELSAADGDNDVHVLGYFVDPGDATFRDALARFKAARETRALEILDRLRDLGIVVPIEVVRSIAGEGAIGRPHIAEALHRAGHVPAFEDAFRLYLGHNGPAYVPKRVLTTRQAFDLVLEAGGVPVLAHPWTMRADPKIPRFAEEGLLGLEVWHPKHDPDVSRYYLEMAKDLGLLSTGGSDFHGARTGNVEIGHGRVPYRVVETLRERRPPPRRSGPASPEGRPESRRGFP